MGEGISTKTTTCLLLIACDLYKVVRQHNHISTNAKTAGANAVYEIVRRMTIRGQEQHRKQSVVGATTVYAVTL